MSTAEGGQEDGNEGGEAAERRKGTPREERDEGWRKGSRARCGVHVGAPSVLCEQR